MRALPILLGAVGLIAISLVMRAPAAAASPVDGAAAYKRCAACHLATGAGVPGAFPPLAGNVRTLAQSAEGRKYMTLVVLKGVSGPLTVEGKTYRGVMPTHGDFDDATIAALLNHVVTKIAKGKAAPFSAADIGAVRKSAGSLNAAGVSKLKPAVAAK